MSINKSNYEIFILDYLDGNLSPEVIAELLLFLEANPDIKEEFQMLSSSHLDADTTASFPDKVWLKTGPDENEPLFLKDDERLAIAAIENDHDPVTREKIITRLSGDSSFAELCALYNKTLIIPDYAIVMNSKSSLKKKEVIHYKQYNDDTWEEAFIAFNEGDLSEQQKADLEFFMSLNPALREDFRVFGKLHLAVDNQVRFPYKGSLKQNGLLRKLVFHPMTASAVAASLILMLLINLLYVNPYVTSRTYLSRRSSSGNLQMALTNPTASVINEIKKDQMAVVKPQNSSQKRISEELKPANSIKNTEGIVLASAEKPEADQDYRHYYTSIYYDLQTVNDILAQETPSKPVNAFQSLTAYTRQKLNNLFNKQSIEAVPFPAFSIWDIADAGIAGLNRMVSSDLKIQRPEEGENGRNFAISGSIFEFSKNQAKP